MSSCQWVTIAEDAGCVSLTMNRPPLNVLNIAMMKELNAALGEARKNPRARVVLIRAEGKAFSAGVDIADHTADRVGEMMREFHEIFKNLFAINVPTVAVVDGAALGGGCEVAIACDMIVASERSKFGQPEIRVGVFPPIAAAIMPGLIGRNRTLEFLMNGEAMTAAEAERIGLVNRVFPVDGFAGSVSGFVSRLTSQSRVILELTKRAVDARLRSGCMEAIEAAEKMYMGEMMKTQDAAEGLKAFLEKRPPVWAHR
ncbi:MAG TPA: enoyl-CoA hydratase-related protein [Bacteroidota bacterium]|nr:enoyl-CoA hydratase-related protein [Bacteroidota bacterium]